MSRGVLVVVSGFSGAGKGTVMKRLLCSLRRLPDDLQIYMIMKKGEKCMSRGVLVVVSGFSGAGKGTVMKRLLEKYDRFADIYDYEERGEVHE